MNKNTKINEEINNLPHRRKNILTGEWILVSPGRTKRPWQGAQYDNKPDDRPEYDPGCYLCPGNKRANGEVNPNYTNTFAFTNDFSALQYDTPSTKQETNSLLKSKTEKGICRVVNFSPYHNLTLAEMKEEDIINVITTWQEEYKTLSSKSHINYVQIFENKGALMGNSNPHPHCQIWAQESVPMEPKKESIRFKQYYHKHERDLLGDYLKLELKLNERIVYQNSAFAVVTPYWAVWPFETMIIVKRSVSNICQLKGKEKKEFANAIKIITTKYDNLFKISFPYSSGIHQEPTDGKKHNEWRVHMHFYPPLLRSASIKKFMVGYEMLAEPQRDITPESSAEILRNLPVIHYGDKLK